MLDPEDQKIVDTIHEHGWQCMHILESDEGPNFSYSVGWWESVASPEAIIFGLRRELQHSILWGLYDQIRVGLRLTEGARVSNLIGGFDCITRRVHPTQMQEHFGFAGWYRQLRGGSLEDVEAFQIFWPGTVDGTYPWESGCSDDVRNRQPALYLPRQAGVA